MRIAKNMVKTAALAGLLLPASTRCAAVNAHCTGGVELKLSAPQASQGSLILAQVRSQKSLREVSGKWNERNCQCRLQLKTESTPNAPPH
jgi:hypothetical protein